MRSIVNCGNNVASEYGGSALPLAYANGGWNEVSWAAVSTDDDVSLPQCKPVSEFLSQVVPTPGLRRLLFPPPGRDGIWKAPRWAIDQTRRFAEGLTLPRISPDAGDVLVILDPWWRCPKSFWRNVAKARRRGALVATVIYDLIPITHTDFVGHRHVKRFRNWLHAAADHTDFFLAISETVKNELRSHLQESCPNQAWTAKRFHSFILGADLSVETNGVVRDSTRRAFEAGNTYLMVGALEQRKNQPFLVDTFETLWKRGVDVRLCLVGSYTKALPEFHQRLTQHAELGRRLFYFSNLNDGELDYCYQNTRALVYPSIVEGFGLPIVETLQHGKPVLASNTPIHREVGGEFCGFFDLASTEALAEMIAGFEKLGHVPGTRPVSEYVAPTWERSCHELIEKCYEHLKGHCHKWDRGDRAA